MSEQGEDAVRHRWPDGEMSRHLDASLRSQEYLEEERRITIRSSYSSLFHGESRIAKQRGEKMIDDIILKRQQKQVLLDKMRHDLNELSQLDRTHYDVVGTRQSPQLASFIRGDVPSSMPGGIGIDPCDFEIESHRRRKELLARQIQYVEDLRREKAKREQNKQKAEAAVAAYSLLQQRRRRRKIVPHDSTRSSQRQSPKSDADLLLSLRRYSKRSRRDDDFKSYPGQSEMELASRQSPDRFFSSRGHDDDTPDETQLNSRNHNLGDDPLWASNRQRFVESQRTVENKPKIRLAPGEGICLALPSDLDQLSGYQRMIREAMEFFQAESVDLLSNIQGRTKNVKQDQIGLRCRFCAHRPFHWRGRGAVYFPGNLTCVYQSAQNMAATHLLGSCEEIPQELKEKLWEARRKQDQESKRKSGKAYWVETSRRLGLGEREGINGVWLL